MSISEYWADHSRRFANFNFVYPVISRRARGLSVGINCTPNGVCSFNCIYCQVYGVRPTHSVPTVDDIMNELKRLLSIYNETKFAEYFPGVEEKDRMLKDIALSGDGEPTLYPYFVRLCAAVRAHCDTPLVLITNAAQIPEGLEHLTEIWGKLDAGTDDFLQSINRPRKKIDIAEIENNLKHIVLKFSLRIQTMLCKVPSEAEIESYAKVVQRIYEANPENLLGVQLYSVARQAVESAVKPLPRSFLEYVKGKLLEINSKLLVEVF
ncbi:MAG: radical SAM protein [Fibromonadales bacterium]|nr:radical SAM protein [Fibromonadales bacterium]